MDKSPLKTLTLEDFLETERHKLTGKLTPVTEESFKKWKSERLSKKAAEEEARKLKEATGKALFEKGGWENSDDSEAESSDDDDDNDEINGDDDSNEKGKQRAQNDIWDLEQLRRETEAAEEAAEQERLEKGQSL